MRSRSRRRLQTLVTALYGPTGNPGRGPGAAGATLGGRVGRPRCRAPVPLGQARGEGAAILAAAAGQLAKLLRTSATGRLSAPP